MVSRSSLSQNPLDDTPEGQLIRFVRGYAAKVESEKIRERSLRGRRARVANGKIHGQGIELYGYRRDKVRGIREVYDPDAAVVRDIFRWYVEERLGVRVIVNRLYEQRIPTPASGKVLYANQERHPQWSKGQIHRILKHKAYIGETITWRFQNNGKVRPESEWIYLPEGTTPALVSMELWHAAQERLATNLGADARNRNRPYLLRGLVRCAVCQCPMHAMSEHQRYRVYRCASREKLGVGPCGGKRVPAEILETWAWNQIIELVQHPHRLKAALQRQRETGPDTALLTDAEATRRRLSTLERQQAKLLHTFREAEDELFPADLIRREMLAIEQEKTQLQTSLKTIEAQLAAAQATTEQVESFITYCQRMQAHLAMAEWAQKRLLFEAFRVTVFANGSDPDGWRMRVHDVDGPHVAVASQTTIRWGSQRRPCGLRSQSRASACARCCL